MTRRLLVLVSAAMLAVLADAAFAQQPTRVWRVGFLVARSRPVSMDSDFFSGFTNGMRDLGYVEGKNLVIEWRFAEGRYERISELAAELVSLPVDVIAADSIATAMAAQKATKTIPVVFGIGADPVALGLVKSLAHPGANVTGITILSNETSVKRIEMLRSLVPGSSLIAVVLNPRSPYSDQGLKSLRAAAEVMGVQLLPLEVSSGEQMESAFAAMVKEHAAAFMLVDDALWTQLVDQIVRLELKYRLPGMGFPRFGGLFYYGQNLWELERIKATYVDKILKGAKPRDLPVEQPTKIELIINRKTAKGLGLTIPPELLLLADKVID